MPGSFVGACRETTAPARRRGGLGVDWVASFTAGPLFSPVLIYQANGTNAKPMAPACAESSEFDACGVVSGIMVTIQGLEFGV